MATPTGRDRGEELTVVSLSRSTAEPDLVRHFDDGPGWPNATREKECAYRRGFIEETRRIVREWADPDDGAFDPFGEVHRARMLRVRIRDRYAVYRAGCAGRRTYHLGYRPGHGVPAARARGRHHALVHVTQAWDEVSDLDRFDRLILPVWLMAVERWAQEPIRPRVTSPPPRPLRAEGVEAVLGAPVKSGSTSDVQAADRPSIAEAPGGPSRVGFGLRVDAVCLAAVEPEPVRWLWAGTVRVGQAFIDRGRTGPGQELPDLGHGCPRVAGRPLAL